MKQRESRLAYLLRVAKVYGNPASGPLAFWHEPPEVNDAAFSGSEYFMRFSGKADYPGPFDDGGIPLLDYRGTIGRQYNPIAIAQFGLARYNRWMSGGAEDDRVAWLRVADWLASQMRLNDFGIHVWVHDFDWPYAQTLKAPWYSGLAQGAGLSMLVRAAIATGESSYKEAAARAFEAFRHETHRGGVVCTDSEGDRWIEEYIVTPPTHILNGFIWALWGVYDYAAWTKVNEAFRLWTACVDTLKRHLEQYDTGWWSLYQVPGNGLEMLASPYYHRLHIVQLRVMHRLTGCPAFADCADRFEGYQRRRLNRGRALAKKVVFKLRHY